MTERRSPHGPEPAYSRPQLATTAVRIADAEGLAAVTMRRLATELGTGGGSLYRYVSSRDELLDLMVDAVTAELPTPAPAGSSWQQRVIALGRSQLDMYRRHRWLADVQQRASVPGGNVLDHFESGLAVLADVPAAVRAKMEALAVLTGVVRLFAQQESAGPQTFEMKPDDGARWPRLQAALRSHPSEPAPGDGLFERVVIGAITGVLGPSTTGGLAADRPEGSTDR